MTIRWDEPKTAFYYLAFQVSPWKIQALGELGVFHCISINQRLTKIQALQEGGHPAFRPLGAVDTLIEHAISNLPFADLIDRTAEHAVNVFDTYLQNTWLGIKAGVRLTLDDDGKEVSMEYPYHYGIRINFDLRQSR
jgi:hypothetical protein